MPPAPFCEPRSDREACGSLLSSASSDGKPTEVGLEPSHAFWSRFRVLGFRVKGLGCRV